MRGRSLNNPMSADFILPIRHTLSANVTFPRDAGEGRDGGNKGRTEVGVGQSYF